MQKILHTYVENPFSGPGFFAFYLLASIALVLTWTLHRKHSTSDTIGWVLLFAQIVPLLVAAHQLYLIYNYPIERQWIRISFDNELDPWKGTIIENHALLHYALLVNIVVINPIASLKGHRKRMIVMTHVFAPILLGYMSYEIFLTPKKDQTLYFGPFAMSYWNFISIYMACMLTLGFTTRHLLIMIPRHVRRQRRGSPLGYWDEDDWSDSKGWRKRCAPLWIRCVRWDTKFASILGVFVYPALALWALGGRLSSSYRGSWAGFYPEVLAGRMNPLWSAIRSAWFVLTMPVTRTSIWEWKQLFGLVFGMGIFAYFILDIWKSRGNITDRLADEETGKKKAES